MSRKPRGKGPKDERGTGPNARSGGPKRHGGLPDRDEILEFVKSSPGRVGKREIARAFGIKGGDRIELNRLLAGMTEDGILSGDRKRLQKKGSLPSVTVLEVTGRDDDG